MRRRQQFRLARPSDDSGAGRSLTVSEPAALASGCRHQVGPDPLGRVLINTPPVAERLVVRVRKHAHEPEFRGGCHGQDCSGEESDSASPIPVIFRGMIKMARTGHRRTNSVCSIDYTQSNPQNPTRNLMPAPKSTPKPQRANTTGPAKGAADAPVRPRGQNSRAAWGVMVYLAGDTPWGSEALREDLAEILKIGGSADLTLVVQHDGPDGGSRYIVPPHASPDLKPTQRFDASTAEGPLSCSTLSAGG